MKKSIWNGLLLALGIALLVGGACLVFWKPRAMETQRMYVHYVMIGIGCGLIGHAAGNIISMRTAKKNPTAYKQMEVEQADERNVAISNRAKAKAFDLMIYVYGALMLLFAILQIDTKAMLLLVFCYMAVDGYCWYCRVKFEKEM